MTYIWKSSSTRQQTLSEVLTSILLDFVISKGLLNCCPSSYSCSLGGIFMDTLIELHR